MSRARSDGHRADSGAAVVIDVTNGAVVAAASHPTYDPGLFVGGITAADLRRLTDERAASGPEVAHHRGDLSSRIDVQGHLGAGGRVRRGLAQGHVRLQPSAIGSVTTSSTTSSRVATDGLTSTAPSSSPATPCSIASRTRRGSTRAASPRRRAGSTPSSPWRAHSDWAGPPSGPPGEAIGTIPDRAWKREYWEASRQETCARARTGYPQLARTDKERAAYLTRLAKENCVSGFQYRAGDAVNLSIGQGDLAVTPMQMAMVFAAIANGHALAATGGCRFPSGTGEVTEIPAHRVGSVPVAGSVLAYVRRALADVTRPGGSAGSAFAGFPQDRFPVAGKTGTGEVFGQDATAWFAGYGPTTRPKYAVVVVVSQGDSARASRHQRSARSSTCFAWNAEAHRCPRMVLVDDYLRSDARVIDALDRAWDRSRVGISSRIGRVRSRAFLLVQSALAAGIAWWVASDVFAHPRPSSRPSSPWSAWGSHTASASVASSRWPSEWPSVSSLPTSSSASRGPVDGRSPPSSSSR